jgi:hypothetical protein
MKYEKPTVTVMETACAAIQGSPKGGVSYDNQAQTTHTPIAAYEADE